MITKTDLDYIEAKTRELVERVLKTRVGYITVEIHAHDFLESQCEINNVRSQSNCHDHDFIRNHILGVTIFMPVKEG